MQGEQCENIVVLWKVVLQKRVRDNVERYCRWCWLTAAWSKRKGFRRDRRKQHKRHMYSCFLFLFAETRTVTRPLHIKPIFIIAYTFAFLRDNLCQNSCILRKCFLPSRSCFFVAKVKAPKRIVQNRFVTLHYESRAKNVTTSRTWGTCMYPDFRFDWLGVTRLCCSVSDFDNGLEE